MTMTIIDGLVDGVHVGQFYQAPERRLAAL